MQDLVTRYLNRFKKERRTRRHLATVLVVLACIVSLGVYWQLKLTGAALTNETFCGKEEHVHDSEDCYEWVLVCGYDDVTETSVTAEELEALWEAGGSETAAEATATAGHTHSAECYQTVTNLVCGLTESEGHTHSESCYTTVLTCGLDEFEGHTHSENCYDEEGNLICGLEESEGHTHDESCYTTELTCGLTDTEGVSETSEGHTHDASCYETEEVLICGQDEAEEAAETASADGLSADEVISETNHVHTAACYEKVLVCELEEHTHSAACLSDNNADVETAEDWEATLPGNLSDNWAEAVVAIAQSQLGYTESSANFTLDEDGETQRGYTRYGAWAGNEYGDWDAMFASFCLHYAGLSTEDFPQATGAYAWAVKLQNLGLYAAAADYTPVAGDLVFLDSDADLKTDRVGIVVSVDEENDSLTVIEGDYATEDGADAVCEVEYALSDETVIGYGVLPEYESNYEVYTASADGVTVTVTAPIGALPEGAELSVALMEEDSDEYKAAAETIGYEETVETVALESEDGIALASEEDAETETVVTSGLAVLDISFMVDGVEVEPTEAVTVSIDASAIIPEEADASTIEVQHLTETENGVEATLVADASEETEGTVTVDAETATAVAEFEVESFSTFTITWNSSTNWNATIYFTITVKHVYVDENGNETELTADTSNVTLSNNGGSVSEEYTFSNYAASIDGYVYSKATYGSATGSEVTTATFTATQSYGNTTRTLTLTNANGTSVYSGTYINNTTVSINVYLVYEKVDLAITDTVSDNGNINAVFSVDVPEDATVTYTWYKDGTEVEDKKVGSTYILSDDGTSLNVALDGCNGNTYKVVVTVTTTAEDGTETTTTYTAEYTVPYYSSLQNGSFETPVNPNTSSDVVWGNQWSNASYLANGGVWQTTGTYMSKDTATYGYYQDIEVINATVNASSSKSGYSWYNGEVQTFSNGVSAETVGSTTFSVPDGVQFVELNCEASGSLYQDVLTVPGSTLNWWLYHRARGNTSSSTAESDTMYLLIMSTELAEELDIKTQADVMNVINNYDSYKDLGVSYWQFTSDDQSWHYYSSDGTSEDDNGTILSAYTVPDGQYLTRFFFVAGTTASGNSTVGNFLDDVGFTTDPLPAENGKGNLQIKKVVYGLSEDDIKDYSVTFAVYKENETTAVGNVTLTYSNYVAAESGTTADGTPYYTLESYISVESADKNTGTKYQVVETVPTVNNYTWSSTDSTSANYYTADNAVTVLENLTTTIEYSNYYDAKTTSITLKKVDSKDSTKTLYGAEFSLKSGTVSREVELSDGTATVENVTYGVQYTLTETVAPDGYNLLAEPIVFTINNDGTVSFISGDEDVASYSKDASENITITIKNVAGYELPSTGGSGTMAFTILGLLLCGGAALLLYRRRALL